MMEGHNNIRRMLLLLAMSWLVVLLPDLAAAWWSQTISQEEPAECRTYSVRRIEFIGNDNTRDRIVRRRIAFSEGKTLSEQDIERTIKNLNRLKRLEKLKREDIEITYAVEDPATPGWHCFADILIRIKEKKRR
jgi:Surface antigen variable number repeat